MSVLSDIKLLMLLGMDVSLLWEIFKYFKDVRSLIFGGMVFSLLYRFYKLELVIVIVIV